MEEIWTKRGEQSSVAVLFHQIVYRNTLYLGNANDQPDGVTQKKKNEMARSFNMSSYTFIQTQA